MIPIFSHKSNRWREFYNPLRGLSLPRVVSLLEAGERGDAAPSGDKGLPHDADPLPQAADGAHSRDDDAFVVDWHLRSVRLNPPTMVADGARGRKQGMRDEG